MSFDVAANYAASFRPASMSDLLAGYRPGTLGSETFARVPFENAAMMQDMAKQGMQEAAATQRLRMQLAAEKYQLDMQAKENALSRQASRRGDALRMAGGALASALPALMGGNAALSGLQDVSPSESMLSMDQFLERQRQSRGLRTQSSRAAVAAALQQFGI